jgi:NAD(P) transhydrogenase subunit alpha
MLKAMKPGSVAVDLAVERGGNIEGVVAGEVAEVEGVKVIGYLNVAGRIAASASLLYAKNLMTFLETMISKETKEIALKPDDELVKATMLTHGGRVVHPNFGGVPTAGGTPAAMPDAAAKKES